MGPFLLQSCFLLLSLLFLRRSSYLSTNTSLPPNPHSPKSIACQYSMPFNCTSVLRSLKHLPFCLFIESSSFPQSKHLHRPRFTPALLLLQTESPHKIQNQRWLCKQSLYHFKLCKISNITWTCSTVLLTEENYWSKNHRQVMWTFTGSW